MNQSNLGILGMFVLTFFFVACASSESDRKDPPLVEGAYRITEDRAKFDELRSQVPEERRVENDEKAFDLELLSNPKRSPQDIKNRFDQALRKKRETFNRDMNRERELYGKEERRRREAKLKELQKERKEFNSAKPDREKRNEFTRDQDERRKDFFAREREARNDFESGFRQRKKDFEDYARTRQSSFYQELKAFTKQYEEEKRKSKDEHLQLEEVLKKNPPTERLQPSGG